MRARGPAAAHTCPEGHTSMTDPAPAPGTVTARPGAAGPNLPRLTTDALTLSYHPGRGGAITGLTRNRDEAPVLWQAPWGVLPVGASRPPATASVAAREGWSGGWRTLFPSSGRAVTLYGADQGYDGEATLAPYVVDEATDTTVTLSTRLVRTPVRITRTIELQDSTVTVSETVRNEGGQAIEMMWGQEIALGAPLLGEGTTVETGAAVVRPEPDVTHSVSYDDVMPWPRTQGNGGPINLRRVPEDNSGLTWQAYLSDFTDHHATVTNHAAGLRARLTWDAEQMPYLWYELEAGGQHDFPHFSGSYYLSLTAASAWPRQGLNDARRVSSTARWLSVDEELTTWVQLEVSDPAAEQPAVPAQIPAEAAPAEAATDGTPDTSE